jgi:hypothetical protein
MDDLSYSVRELVQGDAPLVADYWSQADPDYLIGLGVDLSKLPSRDEFFKTLTEQLKLPLKLRQSYCTIYPKATFTNVGFGEGYRAGFLRGCLWLLLTQRLSTVSATIKASQT